MAPEIINGELYDKKVDIFSLGSILYEMVSFITPFTAKTYSKYITKLSENEYELPETTNKLFIDLIQTLLNKDPKDRPDIEDIITIKPLRKIGFKQLENELNYLKLNYTKKIDLLKQNIVLASNSINKIK